MLRVSVLLSFSLILSLGGAVACTPKESTTALYISEPLLSQPLRFQAWIDLPVQEMNKNSYLKTVDRIGPWIPMVGNAVERVLELPFQMTFFFLPNFTRELELRIPEVPELSQSQLLSKISSLRIKSGFLYMVTKRNAPSGEPLRGILQRLSSLAEGGGKDQQFISAAPEADDISTGPKDNSPRIIRYAKQKLENWQLKEATDASAEVVQNFLSALEIYFVFKGPQSPILVSAAYAEVAKDFLASQRTLFFNSSKINYIEFIKEYGFPEVKIIAVAQPPSEDLVLAGRVLVELVIKSDSGSPPLLEKASGREI